MLEMQLQSAGRHAGDACFSALVVSLADIHRTPLESSILVFTGAVRIPGGGAVFRV